MDAEIIIPEWWRVMHYEKGFDNPDFYGFDSETVDGLPYLIQFWNPSLAKYMFVNGCDIFKQFMEFLETLPGSRIILFNYYSKFDLPVIFFPYIKMFADDSFEMKEYGWEIKVFCSKNWWASFYNGVTGKYVQFVDIFNFFKGGLDKVAKHLGIRVRKLPRPKKLGEYAFAESNRNYIRYAMRDARIAWEEGKRIVDMHKELDIPICLSAPKMAELVFRKHFLKQGDEYLMPSDKKCLEYSILAYHGAKNGYYLDHPAYFMRVHDYDIISAYPYAMSILPSFLSGEYRFVNRFVPDVLNHPGIYYVAADVKPCRYGMLATPNFRLVKEGGEIKTFATGYEILEALRSKEINIRYINGFIFKSSASRNPLQEYVDYFYTKKQQAKKRSVQYEFYKLLLNSLYGKWIQTNPMEREKIVVGDDFAMQLIPQRRMAGGLFNPFIAASITGFIRSELHRLEHRYRAIETSTDSFKTLQEIRLSSSMKRLGGLEIKFQGPALFCRNRLNLLFKDGKVNGYALHGFWGTPDDLYCLFLSHTNNYSVSRIPLARESLIHSGKKPFEMMQEVRTLNIDWNRLKYYDRHGKERKPVY